jgi:hypothetical protein
MLLFRHGGKTSSSSPPPGELMTVTVVVLREKEYHVVAAVEGHELKIPEAEHRPRLKKLLKTPHLELNGREFVNTQQTPTWRTNCRRFGPGGSSEPTSKFIVAACPSPDGLAREVTQQRGIVLSRTGGAARSRGYKRREREAERDREPVRQPVVPSARTLPSSDPTPPPPREKALDLPFIDARRGSRCTMGGVAMRYCIWQRSA